MTRAIISSATTRRSPPAGRASYRSSPRRSPRAIRPTSSFARPRNAWRRQSASSTTWWRSASSVRALVVHVEEARCLPDALEHHPRQVRRRLECTASGASADGLVARRRPARLPPLDALRDVLGVVADGLAGTEAIAVVEGVDVDGGPRPAIGLEDRAQEHAAAAADEEVGGAQAEAVARHERRVGDREADQARGVGHRPLVMAAAERALTGAHRHPPPGGPGLAAHPPVSARASGGEGQG